MSPYAQSLYRSGPNNSSTITVWFRAPSASVCDGSVFAEPIGNTLVVAAPGGAVKLPTTITQALQMGYTSGAFIGGMGRHFARNLVGGGTFAYDALNFFPIVSMFDTVTGNATAVFFMSITRQQSLFPPSTNMWDIIALPNCTCWPPTGGGAHPHSPSVVNQFSCAATSAPRPTAPGPTTPPTCGAPCTVRKEGRGSLVH